MTLREYHSHTSNMQYHDLYTTRPPPNNIAKLLGLGSKFCLQSRNLDQRKFDNMINRLKYNVRVKHFVNNVLGKSNQSMPKLYIKIQNPNISKAPALIEGALKRFKKSLRASFNSRRSFNSTNLTKLQTNILHYFPMHDEYIILLANKNLGPCVMNREVYIRECLT